LIKLIATETVKPKSSNEKYFKWKIENHHGKLIHEFDFLKANYASKFFSVSELIDELNELYPRKFGSWFEKLLEKYIEQNYNSQVVLENCDKILEISKDYFYSKEIDYSRFVNRKKKSRTSVFFDVDDMEAIAIASTALKIYSLFSSDVNLKVTDNVNKLVFAKILSPCTEIETSNKIYQVIRSRICRSSVTDKVMWELIKLSIIETPESYTMIIFNYMMNSMFSTIDINNNPIPFLIGIIDEGLGWLISTAFVTNVLYGDSFGTSEEIYGSSFSKDSLYIYCCNDVIIKASKAALDIIENEYDISEKEFMEIQNRLDNVNSIHHHMKRITLPIASKVLEIPYKYLIMSPPKHVALIGILIHHCSTGNLGEKFPIIMEYLKTIPREKEFSMNKSSYKIKNKEYLINRDDRIFGFTSKKLRFDIISCNCGVLSSSKKDLYNIIDGKSLPKFNYQELEKDALDFYTDLYSGKLEEDFEKMRIKVDSYLG